MYVHGILTKRRIRYRLMAHIPNSERAVLHYAAVKDVLHVLRLHPILDQSDSQQYLVSALRMVIMPSSIKITPSSKAICLSVDANHQKHQHNRSKILAQVIPARLEQQS